MILLPARNNGAHLLALIALLCGNAAGVLGYNVDVTNFVRHRGPTGSMFGFSVAQYKTPGESWLLIGAPEADTIRPGVDKGGAVYKCSMSMDNECEPILFDVKGNNSSTGSIQRDSKSYNWLGATVKSSAESGTVLACAPRYVYFNYEGYNITRKDPVGMCYVTRDLYHFSEYSPCITNNITERDQGTCQAGLGASISKDGNRIFIGAVGRWFWQGQFFSKNLDGQSEVFSTNEGPKSDDNSYFGYSVAVGAFGLGLDSGAAVGMPRGAELLGKVVLYTADLTNLYNITGEQIGAYFGYSICVSDVDGDGGDDIIVGAPMYHEYSKNNDSYETGKVYVYLKKEGYAFYERNTRIGFNSKSRFGLALSGLGDINIDGYGDFAVGAPYDGPDELGAVYIYHGTKSGVREKYSQVIKSEDISVGRPVYTFGFSLSGGLDLDNNQYPDLIIGAYESDTAYLMKSRPVAQITTSVYFKSNYTQIDLKRTECTTNDGTQVHCLFIITCLQYTGVGVDNQLKIEMQLVLDEKKLKSPRMFFLLEENQNTQNNSLILKKKNTQYCLKFQVYLKNNIRDKLTPIEAELRHKIIEDNQRSTGTLTPVIDTDNEQSAFTRASISIQNYCGKDNFCVPDLQLIAIPSSESYSLGSNEKLKVDVKVKNLGENSFETIFDMTIPLGVNYVKIERLDDNEKDVPVQCSAPSEMTNNTLHCDIGNPLPGNKYVQFNVVLEPYQTTETKTAKYEFNMTVNSTNQENLKTVSDNTKSLNIPIWVNTELIIEGWSKPTDVHFNVSRMKDNQNITDEKQIGPQVIHVYIIRNKGPADILEAEAYIDWPLFITAGNPLLYLLEMPETNGQVKCEPIEDLNPLKLNIDRKRKSYFELSGFIVKDQKLSERLLGNITNEGEHKEHVDGKFNKRGMTGSIKRCGPVLCTTIKCTIGPFSKGQDVGLLFRSRVWVETMKKVDINRQVKLSSMMSVKITQLPYIGKPITDELSKVKTHEVMTQIIPRNLATKPNIISLWTVVLAAVAGTYVLLLLIYLLYKCGFFMRNRPSNAPEEQPLTHIKDYAVSNDE